MSMSCCIQTNINEIMVFGGYTANNLGYLFFIFFILLQ